MAAIMIVICIVVVAAGHNGFMRSPEAGAATQPPHTQSEGQRVQDN